MNDAELELRLRQELRARINPPAAAPQRVHDQVRYLRSMRGAGLAEPAGRPRTLRNLFAVAAIITVAMLVVSGILLWQQPKMAATPSPATPTATGPTPRATQTAVPEPGVTDLRLKATAIDGMGRVDARVGWVRVAEGDSGRETIRFTRDGGATWLPARTLPTLVDPDFIDANNGWFAWSLIGQGSTTADVYRTIDGGETWSSVQVPIDHLTDPNYGSSGEFSVHFRDDQNGELFVPVGPLEGSQLSHCQRFSTTDGGETWSGPRNAPCMGVPTFVNESFGWAQGPLLESTIHVTLDGGRTWVSGTLPGAANPTLQLVERTSDGTLRAMASWFGTSSTLTSKDGGRTWTTEYTYGGFDSDYRLAWVGEGHWYAIGGTTLTASAASPAVMRVTENGGATWRTIAPNGLGTLPFRVQFVSPTDGWAMAADWVCSAQYATLCDYGNYTVYATTDGGQNWRPIFAP